MDTKNYDFNIRGFTELLLSIKNYEKTYYGLKYTLKELVDMFGNDLERFVSIGDIIRCMNRGKEVKRFCDMLGLPVDKTYDNMFIKTYLTNSSEEEIDKATAEIEPYILQKVGYHRIFRNSNKEYKLVDID